MGHGSAAQTFENISDLNSPIPLIHPIGDHLTKDALWASSTPTTCTVVYKSKKFASLLTMRNPPKQEACLFHELRLVDLVLKFTIPVQDP